MTTIQTVYTAGPMRNRPYYNAHAFAKVAEKLRYTGYEVISPSELDRDAGLNLGLYPTGTEPLPEGFDLPTLIRRDLDAIDRADVVVVLPGWEFSTGAGVEVAYARFVGKPILSVAEILP